MSRVLGVKVELDDELEKQFEEIKRFTGLKSNAEVFRMLIRYYYRNEVEKNKLKA